MRSAAIFCEIFFLLGVVFVAQWVHNGHMVNGAHTTKGAHTMNARFNQGDAVLTPSGKPATVVTTKRTRGTLAGGRELVCVRYDKGVSPNRWFDAKTLRLVDDHSASRNVDVLRREAPHLIAQPDEPRPITTAEINDAITDAISWLIVAEREHPDCAGITATKHRLVALVGNVVAL